jgi:hypothetical protein
MIAHIKEFWTCQKALVEQISEWRFHVERMDTSEPDETRIARDVCIWCGFVDI